MSNPFHYPKVKIENSWRSIILLGSNTSCYKFALGKTLLEMNTQKTEIFLEDIALTFSKNISQHLLKNKKQTTNPSSSFLDSCKKYNLGEISEDDLFGATMKEGFRYVIDAFHKVGRKEVIRFFEDNRKKNKSILLTDNFYRLLNEDIYGNLSKEVESRWNLWETSISLNTHPNLISLKIDEKGKELVLMDLPVTSARDSIIGYQDGRCFYCQKKTYIKSLTQRCLRS